MKNVKIAVSLIAAVFLVMFLASPKGGRLPETHQFADALNFVPSLDAQTPPIPQAIPVTATATTTGAANTE